MTSGTIRKKGGMKPPQNLTIVALLQQPGTAGPGFAAFSTAAEKEDTCRFVGRVNRYVP
jgi:hypothetical protein